MLGPMLGTMLGPMLGMMLDPMLGAISDLGRCLNRHDLRARAVSVRVKPL
jgi:hypothetical protein